MLCKGINHHAFLKFVIANFMHNQELQKSIIVNSTHSLLQILLRDNEKILRMNRARNLQLVRFISSV